MTSLPQPVQAVVSLFEGPLAGVRFADVDRAGLNKLAAEVQSGASELEAQEAKLASLREELAKRHEALLVLAQQALAYARIYAEGDEALSAHIAEIALPRASKPRKQAATKAVEVTADAPEAARAEPVAQEPGPSTGDTASADDAPLETKPSYARPKVKRKLGRATSQPSSA